MKLGLLDRSWPRYIYSRGFVSRLALSLTCLIVLATSAACGNAEAAATDGSPSEALSAGGAHTCAIRAQGDLDCWGDDSREQLDDTPEGQFLSVSSGGAHTCAIRVDGSIACWGDDSLGQLDDLPQRRYVALATGGAHACAIAGGGSIECWGNDSRGQLEAPPGRFTAISAGAAYTCALRVDGRLFCWGDRSQGQSDDAPAGVWPPNRYHDPSEWFGGAGSLAVSAGGDHTCAIAADGRLDCWGDDTDGQLDGVPTGTFRSVSAGGDHTCAIAADGDLDCWGDNSDGQLDGIPAGAFRSVSAGGAHTCAIAVDGDLDCWGNDSEGQLQGAPSGQDLGGIALAAGSDGDYTCAIPVDGRLQCWGANEDGEPFADVPSEPVLAIAGEPRRACAIQAEGHQVCWGDEGSAAMLPPAFGDSLRTIAAGEAATCGIAIDNELACSGGLGPPPAQLPSEARYRSVAVGSDLACAIRLDGTVACWGAPGQLAVEEAPEGYFRSIAAEGGRVCAIAGDGTLHCWGEDAPSMPEADLDTAFRSVAIGGDRICPIQADGELRCQESQGRETSGLARTVTTGKSHACALEPDAQLVCWGDNSVGQIKPHISGDSAAPDAVVGSPYLHLFRASIQQPGPEFTVAAGELPPGLSLDRNGELSGVATTAGLYSFTLEAANPVTGDATAAISLRVWAPPLVEKPAGLPDPTAGESFNIERTAGTVEVKCPGEEAFAHLVSPKQVPVGCVVDTLHGTAALTASKGDSGATQTASFWGGVFSANQEAGDDRQAVLRLVGKLRCEQKTETAGRLQIRARHGGGGRKLWGSGEGNYKTVGSYGSATVRGTTWLVRDRCDGATQFKVKKGTVWVRDFVKKTQVVLEAGQSYLASGAVHRLP